MVSRLRAALDAGRVPGVQMVGDGQVTDDERHVIGILRDRESPFREDVLDALPHALRAALDAAGPS